jgi:CRISPR-associated protein Cas5 subtype I-B
MLSSFNFDVEAEVAHFRDPTSHAYLNTFLAPPPHTIIGFLGNCCGMPQSEAEDLSDMVKVGCIILELRGFLQDLVIFINQKKIKGKSYSTLPRTRKLLVGPRYRFYVASEDATLLSNLRSMISAPRRTPYLGISDCLAYISSLSGISLAVQKKIKDTDSIVPFDYDIDYYTKIKEPQKITVHTETVRSPTRYEITERGRSPTNQKSFLMSVNCRIFFKKPLDGYEIDGDNVCLM